MWVGCHVSRRHTSYSMKLVWEWMDRDKVEIWLPALVSHYMQLDKRKPSSIQSIHIHSDRVPLIPLQSASPVCLWAHLSTEPSPISAHLSREKHNGATVSCRLCVFRKGKAHPLMRLWWDLAPSVS